MISRGAGAAAISAVWKARWRISHAITAAPRSRPRGSGAVLLPVFVPVPLPAAKSLGIDLVHFGVVVIINFMIAQITPPYGLILFVSSALTGVPVREINREIWQVLRAVERGSAAADIVPRDHPAVAAGVRLQG